MESGTFLPWSISRERRVISFFQAGDCCFKRCMWAAISVRSFSESIAIRCFSCSKDVAVMTLIMAGACQTGNRIRLAKSLNSGKSAPALLPKSINRRACGTSR